MSIALLVTSEMNIEFRCHNLPHLVKIEMHLKKALSLYDTFSLSLSFSPLSYADIKFDSTQFVTDRPKIDTHPSKYCQHQGMRTETDSASSIAMVLF